MRETEETHVSKFPLHWCISIQTSLKLLCKASAMTAIAPNETGLKVGGFVHVSALTLASSSFEHITQNVFHSTIFVLGSLAFFPASSFLFTVMFAVWLFFSSLASFSMRVFFYLFWFSFCPCICTSLSAI